MSYDLMPTVTDACVSPARKALSISLFWASLYKPQSEGGAVNARFKSTKWHHSHKATSPASSPCLPAAIRSSGVDFAPAPESIRLAGEGNGAPRPSTLTMCSGATGCRCSIVTSGTWNSQIRHFPGASCARFIETLSWPSRTTLRRTSRFPPLVVRCTASGLSPLKFSIMAPCKYPRASSIVTRSLPSRRALSSCSAMAFG
mmetsp:Transcript_49542/g.117947  ORF Transcript_49542/g.117947 Transcript_49542/m.117947 type:complete len:201 (+) Transcript_49542:441-1043(+)